MYTYKISKNSRVLNDELESERRYYHDFQIITKKKENEKSCSNIDFHGRILVFKQRIVQI